ncbi:MAG: outer membrane protein assembly factor BamA [Rhodobacteraceae bacterium]|nr:MAG: outer membrane protein assembly factor BamA [Paracoccaceae bacterium]
MFNPSAKGRERRPRRAAAGLLACAAAFAPAPVWLAPTAALAQAGPVVSDVVVIGNRRIDASTVASYLALGPGDVITAEAVNESVRRLFDTGLFEDARITVDGANLVVQVAEAPTINRIAFEGNRVVNDDTLRAAIASAPRRAFTRARAESDAQALVELYRRTGRFAASVNPVVIEQPDNRVDLVFEIEEGRVTRINAITFVGNETFSDRRLRGAIDTTVSNIFSPIISTDIYDPDRLEFDRELLRRFYLARGFADFSVLSATAELAPDREGFFITFTVSEGPRYAFGEQSVVVTAPGLSPEPFEAVLDGRPGDVYNADVVERNIDRMTFIAGQEGFAFIEVRPRAIRNEADLTIDIVYELVEGPRVFVERIEIEGNQRTLDRVIRRQFDIVEGDAFDSRRIDRARGRIRGLGFFRTVDVATEPGSTPDRANVRVTVEEQPTGSLTFGVGFSTQDGVVGEVSLSERNFLGRGQFVRARVVAAGDRQNYSFDFREPAFLDRDLGAGFRVYYSRDDRRDESSFRENNIGFVPEVDFPVSEFGRLFVNYRISDDEITNVRDDASPFIAADEGSAITSSVGYRYVYDRRNDPLEPSQGYFLEFSQDFAGLGGDTQYVRTRGRARAFTSFFDEEVVLSFEVEGGNITGFGGDDIRITDRYFLGGDRFRGFSRFGLGPRDLDSANRDALGGKNFVVARTEVSFPLGLPDAFGVYGGLFTDVGTLWSLDTTRIGGATVDDSAKLRASVGASLFWSSPFGPIRINVATPIIDEDGDEDEIFRLTAGTRF